MTFLRRKRKTCRFCKEKFDRSELDSYGRCPKCAKGE